MTPRLHIHRTVAILLLATLRYSHAFAPKLHGSLPRVVTPSKLASPKVQDVIHRSTPGVGFAWRRSSTTELHVLGSGGFGLGGPIRDIVTSIFRYEGSVPFLQAFGWNAFLFAALQSKLFTMLTPTGFAHSLALGTMLWMTLGWRGWTLCVLYLFLGQAVTKIRFAEKERRGIAESRGGRRGPENVWGSALTALICAGCSVQGDTFLGIGADLFRLGYVAALGTKLADTFASEIGKAYGKTTFLITTLERVEPGTEGAISAEGTAAAMLGGSLLPLYGWAVGLIDAPSVIVATIAAFFATNVESLIGATLQEKKGYAWMTNEVVNFINTVVGAGAGIAGAMLFLGMA